MIFELKSALEVGWSHNPQLKEYFLSSPNITLGEDKYKNECLYIEFDDFYELEEFVRNIPDFIYEGTSGWKPTDVLIDFKSRSIILRDFYLE